MEEDKNTMKTPRNYAKDIASGITRTYKEGPPSRANGRATKDAREDKVLGPCVNLPEEDKDKRLPGGVRRP